MDNNSLPGVQFRAWMSKYIPLLYMNVFIYQRPIPGADVANIYY